MKIRNGFVSNSSSSSFVIRGTKVNQEVLAKTWGAEVNNLYFAGSKRELQVRETRDFFDGEETDEVIVGVKLAELEDGCVLELPEGNNDVNIRMKLKENGILVDSLSTFVQFISNDNY